MKARPFTLFLAALTLALSPTARAEDSNSLPVNIHVDAAKPLGELHPIWRFFGADEPNYATMKNGTKLIGELGALSSESRLFPHPQPAHLRRRHRRRQMGFHGRLQRGRERQPHL